MKINNLSKTYKDKKVLDFNSFEFKNNNIYAIIGANGSGKSTLGKAISGIINVDSPKEFKPYKELKIGYMSQHNYAFKMSVIKNIKLGSEEVSDTSIKKLAKKLDINKLLEQPATKLSGGETAKMALIRILIKDYDVLILDEPCASMDVKSTLASEELIKEYQEKHHGIIILITHSINQALRLADTTLFMHEGKLVEANKTKTLINKPKSDKLKEFIKLYSL